jgi:hypothetical protein
MKAFFAWFIICVAAFLMGYLSIPISYEMWLGDIKAGDRMFGDAFAPTLAGALCGIAIEAVIIAACFKLLHSISKARKRAPSA